MVLGSFWVSISNVEIDLIHKGIKTKGIASIRIPFAARRNRPDS